MKKQTIVLGALTVVIMISFVITLSIRPCEAGDYPGKWYGWYFPQVKLKGLDGRGAYSVSGWAHEDQKIIKSWGYKANNVDEIKDLLPWMYYQMVKHPDDWGNLRINETAFVPRGGEFMKRLNAATEKYKGQPYLNEQGELCNYKAGMPFPGTEDPLKLAWNFQKRAAYCDAMRGSAVSMNTNFKGQMRGTDLEMNQFNFDRRLFGENAPLYEPNPRNLEHLYAMGWKYPYGVRGIVSKTIRYLGDKDDDMWLYLPALRRVRRMSTTQRWDRTPGGSVSMWDMIQGFSGKVKNYEWKYLGRKELLVGHNASPECQKLKDAPGGIPNQLYQRVNTVVLEYIPKPHMNAPVSNVVMYIDPISYVVYFAELFDLKGKPYMLYQHCYAEDNDGIIVEANILIVNFQRRTTSNIYNYSPEYNEGAPGIQPGWFEMERMRKYFGAR